MTEVEQPPAPPPLDRASLPPSRDNAAEAINITFTHHGTAHTLDMAPDATITDLSSKIEIDLHIPPSHQKFMITPKLGLLKPPFTSNPTLPLTALQNKKIVLLAPTSSEITSLSRPSTTPRASVLKPATPTPTRDWKKAQEEATYTFDTIIPLPYLPNPDRSKRFLEGLAADAGIKSAMRKHRFHVNVLTEMDPAQHTTHESRTLGLNRNRGEVIELRLRTDAYDGYRDYKTIRDTLCHELAHNVHGEHDRRFWDLCKEIERDVRAGDWRSGGQTVSREVFYDAADPEVRNGEAHVDGGGWVGGEFVLGGSTAGRGGGGGSGGGGGGSASIDRREAMARAAEERMKREKEMKSDAAKGGKS